MEKSVMEKIVYTILGAIVGIVVGLIILSLNLTVVATNAKLVCIVLFAIAGISIAINFIIYNEKMDMKNGEKLRNENISLITHEMRTSLTSTSWAIYSILNNYGQVMKSEDRSMLDDTVKSIHTTVMHTVNLLDVSLNNIGKLSISLEPIKLEEIEIMIRETIEKYEAGAKKEGVELITEIGLVYDKNIEVEVDKLRLRIIIENLLENALQYGKESSDPNWKKLIRVRVKNTKSTLDISIGDNGIGIPKSEQSQIFEEFYRASNARKKLSSGSGIGLSMCFQYIKAHHGTITFESKENEGTTFFISLPLRTVADVKGFLEKI